MKALKILYKKYIDQPKLTQQKKNKFEFIVLPPPPLRGLEQQEIKI